MKICGLRNPGQVFNLPFTFSALRAAPVARFFILLAALAIVAAPGIGVSYAQEPGDDNDAYDGYGEYDEAEAQAIDRMLMCPVCPAESIDQAQVPLAKQMRQRVREMLAAGASRQEVLDYFADRYGQNVLASPPKSGLNLLAWLLPVAGLAAALVAVTLALRAMTGRRDGADEGEDGKVGEGVNPEEPGDAELQPYLAAVDRTLAIDAPEGNGPEQDTGAVGERPPDDDDKVSGRTDDGE